MDILFPSYYLVPLVDQNGLDYHYGMSVSLVVTATTVRPGAQRPLRNRGQIVLFNLRATKITHFFCLPSFLHQNLFYSFL